MAVARPAAVELQMIGVGAGAAGDDEDDGSPIGPGSPKIRPIKQPSPPASAESRSILGI